jgi:hypothetical protein
VVAKSDELEAARLQQDIDRTRQQLSGTIDELQERLTPSRLLHDATASVRQASVDSMRRLFSRASRTAGRTAGRTRVASSAAAGFARSHPVPSALALSGLVLVVARTLSRRRHSRDRDGGSPAGGYEPLNDAHVHSEFKDWTEPSGYSRRSSNSRRSTPSLTSWIAENSLAVGAAVAAAGTVVGLSRSASSGSVSRRR